MTPLHPRLLPGRQATRCFPSILFASLVAMCLVRPAAGWQEKDEPSGDAPPPAATADAPAEQRLSAEGEWYVLEPEGAGFRAELPAEPGHFPRVVRPVKEVEIQVDLYMLEMKSGRLAFIVGWHDVQEEPETDAKRREILDGGVKGAMINVLGRMTSHERMEVEGHPARHFTYSGSRDQRQIEGQTRLVLVGRRVYQLSVIHMASENPDAAAVSRFFDSFRFTGNTP